MSDAPRLADNFTAAPNWRARAAALARTSREPIEIAAVVTIHAGKIAGLAFASVAIVVGLCTMADWLN